MANKARVYIDANCFISLLKGTPPATVPQGAAAAHIAALRALLEAHQAGEVIVMTSTITITECLWTVPTNGATPSDRSGFEALLTSGKNVVLTQPTASIAIRARDLNWRDGLFVSKPFDYVQLASALDPMCSEFITFDVPILNNCRAKLTALGLRPCMPNDTRHLSDARRQLTLPGSGVVDLVSAKVKRAKRSASKSTKS